MRALILSILFLSLAACNDGGGGGDSSSAAATPVSSSPAVSPPVPVIPPTNNVVALTYYSKTTQLGVPTAFTSFTGSCIQYMTKTYCWDDGEKQIQSLFYCSFWEISGDVSEGCTALNKVDSLTSPRTVSANMLNEMMVRNLMLITPTQILNAGTPTNVNCTDDGATLDCVSFQVDLTQAEL